MSTATVTKQAVPTTAEEAFKVAQRLAAAFDKARGGALERAAEKLKPPVDRYQANGVVVGILGEGTITTLDGETFGAELSPKLRVWREKNSEAAAAPARWIVYPRTVPGGLAFYVVGQRRALPGETEAQLNRQVDRFTITGVCTNSRGMRKQTCVRICRNKPAPKGLKKHPSWRPRFLFLAGLPPAPTKSWWNKDVRIHCQRVGRELRILAMERVGQGGVKRHLAIGPAVLPWPWKPSSQAIWRLCQQEALADVPPWPGSDAEADQIIERYLAVMHLLLTELAPTVLARQAGQIDPVKRRELAALGQYQDNLIRQWVAATDRFLSGLEESDRAGLSDAHQLKQRLAMAMVSDFEGTLEIEGARFWFEGWPVRGRAARILRENLPLAGGGTVEGIEAQEAPPVDQRKTRKRPAAAKPVLTAEELIDQLTEQAERERWSDPLLHLRVTKALAELELS